ncbi:MAG TPA: NB-ARC domain-containing protein [Gaiellaceae bacterium]|nr:NB-ARC domain-containing protein [Gaiellaceae bacterium]
MGEEGRRLRVFISSSPGELTDERDAARAAVRTLRLAPVMREPGDGGRPDGRGDIFVGLYWQRYGWKADVSAASAVEDEYFGGGELPRLVYVKEPAPEREPELVRFLEEIRSADRVDCRTFATPGELAELLLEDLAELLARRFHGGRSPSQELPEGTVTLLFADLDGSTPIVRLLGAAYPGGVLEPFRAVVTEAAGTNGGAVVDFEGDGAFCAFATAEGAAAAAVEIQRTLVARTWPEGLDVIARIGIHTGAVLRTPDGYAGIEVHRAARIGAAANGGQILASRATADLLDASSRLAATDLGSFALKGLDRAEQLLQLSADGLERDLPAPRARGASSVRLPAHLSRLVGRDDEIQGIVSRLEPHEVRLVTLTGPGGIGKTRLATAAAEQAAPAYPDGVYFVALAEARTSEQVISATAESLGVRGEGARPLLDTLEERLAADRVLLVLDNFEQVLDAAPAVARLLSSCPGTDVLVTSRTPLRVEGEWEYPLRPLAASAALELFVERAAASRPDCSPTAGERGLVEEICRRLDGLPLAIELAASRLRVLEPADLLERLAGRLDVVGGSMPSLPDRQRTLTATIDWSYELLDRAERALFARLAVFSGGWTVAAAEGVCGDEPANDVLATLERLVQHSLVVTERGRMRMLETIREYAAARLEESGEGDLVRTRHAAYFDGFVEDVHSLFAGPRAPEALAALDGDWENIDAVAQRSVAAGEFTRPVRLASLTWRYVWLHDRVREATAWMPLAYEARSDLEPALRGELCRIWGSALYQFGEYERAKAALEEAVELLAVTGPPDREGWARTLLAGLAPHFGTDLDDSIAEASRAVEIFTSEHNHFGLATALALVGTLETLTGRAEEGTAHIDESIEAARLLGLTSLIGANLSLRALAALAAGDASEAREYLEAAVGMPIFLEGTAYCLEGLAAISLAEGDEIRAATALGAAEGLRERTGIRMWPALEVAFRPAIEALHAAGPAAQAARYEGSYMNPRTALVRLVSNRSEIAVG